MADSVGAESSFPENPQGSALNSSLNNLSGETQKLRLGMEELTKTLREEKAKESTESSKEILDCLKEMKGHLHSLLILQRESSALREEERRRTESEIADSPIGGGGGAKETKGGKPVEIKGGGGFSEMAKGVLYLAASVVALGVGLKLMKDIGLAEIVKTFVLLAVLGTGLLVLSKLGSGSEMQKTAVSLIILAGAIAALSLSLRLIEGVKWASLIKGTFAIILLGGALGILSSLFGGDSMIKVGLSMIVLAGSLFALSFALDFFSKVNYGAIVKGAFAIGTLGIVLGLVSLFDPVKLIVASAAFIVLSGAFIALSFALDMFSKLSWMSIVKGVIGLGVLGVTLGLISLVFGGDRIIKAATGLLIFSGALAVFSAALLIMNYVNVSSILKMFGAMVLIMPIFTALMLVLTPVMIGFGVALWLMSYALSNFADAVYTLAKALLVGAIGFYILKTAVQSMSWEDLAKVGVVIVGLAAVLVGLNYALKAVGQQTFYKTAFALAFFGLSLIPLSIGLKMLEFVGWEALAKGAVAILGFGLIAKLIGKESGSMIKAGLGFLAFGLGLIPFAMGIKMFSGISPGTVLTAAAALFAVGGLAAMLAKGNTGNIIKAGLGLLALGIGLIPFAAGIKLFGGVTPETILITAAAILTIGWLSANTIGNNLGGILKASIGMVALSVGLIGLSIGLSIFQEVSMGAVLVAAAALLLVGGAAILISNMGVGGMLKGALGIAAIGLSLIPLAISLAVFSEVGLDTVLIAAAAIALIGGAGFLIGSFGLGPILMGALGIAALGLALMPLAIGLSMMSEIGMDTIGVLALSLVTLGLAALGMGLVAPVILMGALAIAALGVALIPLAFALDAFKGAPLKELSTSLYDFGLAAAMMGILSPLILLGSVVLIALSAAVLILGAGLSLGGEYLQEFNKTIVTFGAVAVTIIDAIGGVFGKFVEIIQATGTAIGYVIDKIKDLANPEMGLALGSTAAGILLVAGALGTLLAVGAAGSVVGGVATAVGGVLTGIGNFFAGTQGGALNAVQTLALVVQAAEYVSEIGQLSSEIDKLTAALNKLSQSPPINAQVMTQIDELIQKAEKLSSVTKEGFLDKILGVFGFGSEEKYTPKASYQGIKPYSVSGTGVQGSLIDEVDLAAFYPSNADYSTLLAAADRERNKIGASYTDRGREAHTKLLQEILQELRRRDDLRTQMSNIVNAPSTNISGGGGGQQIIPIVTSSNRDSTWKATQGSLRPLG